MSGAVIVGREGLVFGVIGGSSDIVAVIVWGALGMMMVSIGDVHAEPRGVMLCTVFFLCNEASSAVGE